MKKSIYKVMSMMMVAVATLSSCDKGFEEVNTDPINIKDTTPDKLLAPALVNAIGAGMQRNRNFNNELMQVTVAISDGDATVFRYEYRRTIADYLWNAWYVQLTNFKDIYTLANEPGKVNKSYQGISLILQSWLFANLTDTYGDVPYFQASQGKDGILEPAFDKQKDIYQDIFKKLEEANTLLSAGTAITVSSDPVFQGNVARWRKLGNSLYLRLLLRTSAKADVSASNIAKIKQIAETPATYPIIASNAESGVLKWSGEVGTGPYVSPWVNGVRAQDFRSPAIASFFIDHLRDWQDPRLDISATSGYPATGQVNRYGIAQGSAGFSGVPSGYSVGAGVTTQAYFYATDNTISSVAIGARSLQQNPLTGIIMQYGEVQFILAEAALRGWITTAILQNLTIILVLLTLLTIGYQFPTSTTSTVFINYINSADIDWLPAGTFDQKLEQIQLQKYYTLFCTDLQQWFEYRRTGHPILPKGPGLRNGGVMPARMTYPVYVQSANPTNYKLAVASQGADEIFTNVWWQKP
jgi:hypothetical protein